MTGQELAALKGHSGTVYQAVFSPHGGRRVLTVSMDHSTRVWDPTSGRQVALLDGAGNGPTPPSFSPDGRRILTAEQDGSVRMWDTETGQQVASLGRLPGQIGTATFSPDGKTVLTASDGGPARLWLFGPE